jgi:hypothetical protein
VGQPSYPPSSPVRRDFQAFAVPIAMMVILVTFVFSFQYYGSDDWAIGIVVAVVGTSLMAFIIFLAVHQEKASGHHAVSFERKGFVIGMMVLVGGMAVLLYGGSVSTSYVAWIISALGVLAAVAGAFWIIVSLRG